MRLLVLSADEVRTVIDIKQAIAAMRDAFGQLSAGQARVPVRLRVEGNNGVALFMPAYLEKGRDFGAKIVSFFGDNPQRGLPAIHGVVLVLDGDTGVPRALMDAAYLTALRTGAATGLATDLLAKPTASVLTIFGAGGQAEAQVAAVRAVRPIREVRVVSRSRQSAEKFAATIKGATAKVLSDPKAAVTGAHVIIAVTTSTTPVFNGNDIEPGTHVNGVGSYTPAMQEVDATVVKRARVVVDSRTAALEEAGDLITPIKQGALKPDRIDELGEIVNGVKPGRTSDDQITFFKSVGVAVQDVTMARRILTAAESKGHARAVEL